MMRGKVKILTAVVFLGAAATLHAHDDGLHLAAGIVNLVSTAIAPRTVVVNTTPAVATTQVVTATPMVVTTQPCYYPAPAPCHHHPAPPPCGRHGGHGGYGAEPHHHRGK